MQTTQSNSCTVWLKSAAERKDDFEQRQYDARRALLATLLETNHACVHPLNCNYVADATKTSDLFYWGRANGLLTRSDEALLRGY